MRSRCACLHALYILYCFAHLLLSLLLLLCVAISVCVHACGICRCTCLCLYTCSGLSCPCILRRRGACDRQRHSSSTKDPRGGMRQSRSSSAIDAKRSTRSTSRSKEKHISSGSRFYANLVMSRNSNSCGTFSEALQNSTEIDFTGVQTPVRGGTRTSPTASSLSRRTSPSAASRRGSLGSRSMYPSSPEDQVHEGRCRRGWGGRRGRVCRSRGGW